MNKKILNIKITEDDFNLIQMIVLDYIVRLQNNVKDNLSIEEKDKILFSVQKGKILLGKLNTCKIYNDCEER